VSYVRKKKKKMSEAAMLWVDNECQSIPGRFLVGFDNFQHEKSIGFSVTYPGEDRA